MEGLQLRSCIPEKRSGNNPDLILNPITALSIRPGRKTNRMKQELIRTRLLIMAACAFASIMIVGMFAAAGYL
jgi:hypothetical protein